MRNPADLLKGQERVWFLIGHDQELQRHFIRDCIACGCDVTPDAACGWAMSLNTDRKLLFVSMIPWLYSFKPGYSISDVLKVDYRRFASGEDDYVLTESGFTGGFSPM